MDHDTFEIKATIKNFERQNSVGALAFVAFPAAFFWFFGESLSRGEHIVSMLVLFFGVMNIYEIRQNRLDVLRASLRQVLIAKDPTILTNEEW